MPPAACAPCNADEVNGMSSDNTWSLPLGDPPELELRADWGSITIQPVEAGGTPRVELTRGSTEDFLVDIQKHGDVVRVAVDSQHAGAGWSLVSNRGTWFGGNWECHVSLYVPRNVRVHMQTSAGNITVRDLEACELGIKANAGKIDLTNVHGVLHLAADAGSIAGRQIGGFLGIETQAGSVRLDIDELQPGEHRIRAMMGSVRLELARGLDVSIETRTSLGSIRNRYPSNSAAAAKLQLTTEMGEVRVDEGAFERHTPTASTATEPAPPPSTEAAASASWGVTSSVVSSVTTSTSSTSVSNASPASSKASEPSDPELERILKMVEAGEISAQEADDLLQAMGRV
jgi:hypothetical protein